MTYDAFIEGKNTIIKADYYCCDLFFIFNVRSVLVWIKYDSTNYGVN